MDFAGTYDELDRQPTEPAHAAGSSALFIPEHRGPFQRSPGAASMNVTTS